ncbi:MAG: L,D-transpeptidase family protein [Propionibacteriaceae bacterium]|nr:L,D-transpeptidase family protein [Propionibacteriaceae bacterium]
MNSTDTTRSEEGKPSSTPSLDPSTPATGLPGADGPVSAAGTVPLETGPAALTEGFAPDSAAAYFPAWAASADAGVTAGIDPAAPVAAASDGDGSSPLPAAALPTAADTPAVAAVAPPGATPAAPEGLPAVEAAASSEIPLAAAAVAVPAEAPAAGAESAAGPEIAPAAAGVEDVPAVSPAGVEAVVPAEAPLVVSELAAEAAPAAAGVEDVPAVSPAGVEAAAPAEAPLAAPDSAAAPEATTAVADDSLPVAAAPIPPAPKPGRRRAKTVVLVSLAVVIVAALAGAAVFAAAYYGERAKPGVTLAGERVAGQDAVQLKNTAAAIGQKLRLPLTVSGKTVEATGRDLGVTVDAARSSDAALAQGRGAAFWSAYNPFVPKTASLALHVDESALQYYLDDRFVSAASAAAEPRVAYDEAAGRFVVTPGHTGQTVDTAPLLAALGHYAADGSDALAPLTLTVKPDLPQISDAAAEAAANAANARLGLSIVIDNGMKGLAARSYQIPAALIAAWTVVQPQPVDGEVELKVDKAKIEAELPALLAEALTVAMRPQTTLVYPGTTNVIDIVEWGIDGTKMTDPASALAAVTAALEEGRDAAVTASVEVVPFEEITKEPPQNYGEPNGAKWIDINKSNFTVTLYEGTTAVRSFLVSIGAGGKYETTDGVFYIYLKYDHQVMRGPPEDPYVSPTDWVSYFNSDIAFHSAPWNEPNGWGRRVSHGCVNMKTADSKAVYDWAPLGTKVEVHY